MRSRFQRHDADAGGGRRLAGRACRFALAAGATSMLTAVVGAAFVTSGLAASPHKLGAAPEVRSVSPGEGLTAGGTTVVITGKKMLEATAVNFGDVSVTEFTVKGTKQSASITVVTPPETVGRVPVTVTSPSGTSLPREGCKVKRGKEVSCKFEPHFDFVEPTVTGISPKSGPESGGTSVTLTGSGFAVGTSATEVLFGKVSSTEVDCSSSSTCVAVAPAHAAGTVPVFVKVESNLAKNKSAENPEAEFTFE